MLLRLLLTAGALTFLDPSPLPAQSPPDGRRSLEAAGARRSYLLHVPAERQSGQPLPLLLVFHGAGGDAASMAEHTGLTAPAAARGYAVVYPEGVDRRWNDGRRTGPVQDDVGFIRLLLDSLRTELPVDPGRIYATGISNGAGLAFRLACELPGTFAAIAPVAGGLATALEERCAASAPVSLVMFQGTRDPLMPYDGGMVSLRRGRVVGAPRTAALFARVDGCAAEPVIAAEPDTATDGTRVRRSTYPGCREGREVLLFTVEGGGHTWPGGPPVGRAVGRVTRDLDATRTMLDFFDRHTLP
jgi:polyhydroxybutyrate depolymerase